MGFTQRGRIYIMATLQNDSDELTNAIDDYPNIAKELRERLNQWAKWSQEYTPSNTSSDELPKEVIEEARKHGYW